MNLKHGIVLYRNFHRWYIPHHEHITKLEHVAQLE